MRRRGIARLSMAMALTLCAAKAGEAQCSISQAPNVAFGSYDVFASTPLDSVGTIGYVCGPPAKWITIYLSTGSSGTFAQRTMLSGVNTLGYNLFLDATRTTVWGNGTGGSSFYGPVKIKNWVLTYLSVYGRIPAGQDAAAGSYSDTLTVTINF